MSRRPNAMDTIDAARFVFQLSSCSHTLIRFSCHGFVRGPHQVPRVCSLTISIVQT